MVDLVLIFGQDLGMNTNINEFNNLGFTIVHQMYDMNSHTRVYPDVFKYIKSIINESEMDDQVPFAPSFYKNREMLKIQIRLLSKMEEVTGLKLYPTYTYSRIYNKKSILEKHTDRPACEISGTLCIGYDGDYNWPLWIKDNDDKSHSIMLEPGDGLIYRGCNNEHWREAADDRVKCQSQLFIHYIDQNGPYEDNIYDWNKM